jgi:hypothetical protein
VVRKLSWLEEAQDEAIMNVPREEVNRWLGDLDILREHVNRKVTELEQRLPCQRMQISFRAVFEDSLKKG